MKKINGIFNLTYNESELFYKAVIDRIEELQKDGQEVEVQYSTDIIEGNIENKIAYSALILGRK